MYQIEDLTFKLLNLIGHYPLRRSKYLGFHLNGWDILLFEVLVGIIVHRIGCYCKFSELFINQLDESDAFNGCSRFNKNSEYLKWFLKTATVFGTSENYLNMMIISKNISS